MCYEPFTGPHGRELFRGCADSVLWPAHDSFLIAAPNIGVISATSTDHALWSVIGTSEDIASAARRTREVGPFPIVADDSPALLSIDVPNGVFSVDNMATSSTGEISSSTLEVVDAAIPILKIQPNGGTREISCSSDLETLTAAYAFLRRSILPSGDALALELVSIESRVIEYLLVGHAMRLHRVLRDDDIADSTVPPAQSSDDALTIADAMVAGLEALSDHLNHVVHQLPRFLAERDKALLTANTVDPQMMKESIDGHRAAFAPMRSVRSEILNMRDVLSRANGVSQNAPKASMAGAATSIGMAAVTANPLFLMNLGRQVMSQADRKETVDRTLIETVNGVLRRWEELIVFTIPSSAATVTDSAVAWRWKVAELAVATKSREVEERMSIRAGRLAAYLEFAESPGTGKRSDLLNFSRLLRDSVSGESFAPF